MTVYIDRARIPYRNMIMCHMVADNIDDLFRMAQAIGMRAEWFQPRSFPHFDVSATRKHQALSYGAIEVGRREIVGIMRSYRARILQDSEEKRRLEYLTSRPNYRFLSAQRSLS